MSSLIVEVCSIKEIKPHYNSDNLELAEIKGWQVVVKKGEYKQGNLVVYIPPDAVMPDELANRLGVAKYLSPVFPHGYRVKAVRLRGEPSYGLAVSLNEVGVEGEEGLDVAEALGITKWEPPTNNSGGGQGDAAKDLANFPRYTSMENINNFPNIIQEDEYVIVTEKYHGRNVRVGFIKEADEYGNLDYIFVAGSHNTRRKYNTDCMYWENFDVANATTNPYLRLLTELSHNFGDDVVMYGELIGNGMQKMDYGIKDGTTVVVFDIMVGGKYLNYSEFKVWCDEFKVPRVKVLWEGYYSFDKIKELTNGPTTFCKPEEASGFKGREGVVVRLNEERHSKKIGRVLLKSVSVDYLALKNMSDAH